MERALLIWPCALCGEQHVFSRNDLVGMIEKDVQKAADPYLKNCSCGQNFHLSRAFVENWIQRRDMNRRWDCLS